MVRVVCKIPLLARALGLKAEQAAAKRARVVRISCMQGLRLGLGLVIIRSLANNR